MENCNLRRVMWIIILIASLTLGMIFDNIVIKVSLVAADSVVRTFSSFGIPADYFYNKSWHISQIILILHDFITAIYLATIIFLLIWVIVKCIVRPRVNVLDI